MITRRTLFAGAFLGLTALARAQTRRPRIGIVLSESLIPSYHEALIRELERLGWRDGVTFDLMIASADGEPTRLPPVVRAMVEWAPDVIISSSNRTHIALSDQNTSIPIIAVSSIDPLRLGLSDSLSRPSRNFTGTVGFVEGLMEKRIELLHEVIPQARRIALHLDPGNPAFPATHEDAQKAASRFGIDLMIAGYRNREEVVNALRKSKDLGAQTFVVVPDALALPQMEAIVATANDLGLPILGFNPNELKLGFTFVLGVDRALLWSEAARTADKLLRGSKVADMPFTRPTKVHVGVNLKAAKALGLDVPLQVLARADEVIE